MSATSPRVWLISGANTGLGLELALKVLSEGEKVIAAVRNPSKIPEELKRSDVVPLAFDLTWSQEKINSYATEAFAVFGKIDVVVNNAGFAYFGAIEESTDEGLKQQYDINVFGIARVVRAVLPALRAQGFGTIANISSLGGILSGAGTGMYCSSKFALEGITWALAEEIAAFGLRAVLIEPGYFRTSFLTSQAAGQNMTEQNPAYDGTPAHETAKAIVGYNGKQPGNPKLGAIRMWEAITMEGMFKGKKALLRVPLGTDSGNTMRMVAATMNQTADEYEEIWKSTDFTQ